MTRFIGSSASGSTATRSTVEDDDDKADTQEASDELDTFEDEDKIEAADETGTTASGSGEGERIRLFKNDPRIRLHVSWALALRSLKGDLKNILATADT